MSAQRDIRYLVVATAAVMAMPAWSLTIPKACGSDERVQCASYSSDAVYRVATKRGSAVLLELEPGEKILDDGAGIGGEPGTWVSATNERGFLLQPAKPYDNTNLLLVTNRRVYTFSLQQARKGEPLTWILRMEYPETRAKAEAQEREKQLAEQRKKEEVLLAQQRAAAQDLVDRVSQAEPPQPSRRNEAYSMRGDRDIAPSAVWDDGRFTYFRYRGGDLPRVFQLLPDGQEAQPNFHMDGDTMVVHAVARGFVVRLGTAVMGIRNDAFVEEDYNARGTGVGGGTRVLRGTEQPGQRTSATPSATKPLAAGGGS